MTPKGNPLEGHWRDSYCGLDIDHDEADALSGAIASLLDRIRPHRGVLDALHASGGTFELVVHWTSGANTGETFEPHLLRALADMNIALGIDVYCGGLGGEVAAPI